MTKSVVAAFALGCLVMFGSIGSARAYSLRHTSEGKQVRWYRGSVTLKMDAKIDRLMAGRNARASAIMASEAWRGLPGTPDIVIEDGEPPAYDRARRGNGIYLLSEWPYSPEQVAITLVTYQSTGEILGADILVNGSKRFGMLSEDGSSALAAEHDLAAVLTHEFGHLLGLDDSHDDEEASMWPYIRAGEAHQRSLSQDDEEAAVDAYSGAAALPAAAACSVSAGPGQSAGSVNALFALLFAAAVAVRGARCARNR